MALEELGDCIPHLDNVEDQISMKELSRLLDRFLRSLPERDCCVFMRRYWYVESTREIARRYEMAEGSVKSILHRTRQKLRNYLEKEGVAI